MSRISLAGALGIVATLAMGLAAMRTPGEAGDVGARVVFASTLGLHAIGLVGTLLRRGREPGWLGFTVVGGAFFLAVTADTFDGTAGFSYLPSGDLARWAFDRSHPPPEPPVVDGVKLTEEPDKMTASDAALEAYAAHQVAINARDLHQRRVGVIADLLASLMAGLLGAVVGRRLVPIAQAPRRRPPRRRRRRPSTAFRTPP